MIFKIEWHPQAFKILESLEQDIIRRVLKRIDKVAENPFQFLEHYEGDKVYKLRIGDYRALVDIDMNERVLLIQQFDHRGKIYKR